MTERPTETSAAATTMMKKTNSWASVPEAEAGFSWWCILENATKSKFTEFNISSTHIKITMAFRRIVTPKTPMVKRINAKII